MRKASLAFSALILLSVAALSTPTQVHAAAYSTSNLKGSYSMLTNTWLSNQSDDPCASLDIANFDGVGTFTIAIYQNCAGTVNRYSGTGTYSVAKDGTGSMNIALSGNSGSATEAVVVDSSGKSFQFVQTSCTYCASSTDVSGGTAIAMGASAFSNASLKGSYEWMMTKWTNTQDAGAGVALGVLTFDGVGNVKGSLTDVNDGSVTSLTFAGTYSVNPGGDGVMTLDGSVNYPFVVNAANSTGLAAKGLQLIEAAQGNHLYSGTATKH